MTISCYFCKDQDGPFEFAYSGPNAVMVCEKCGERIRENTAKRKEKKNDTTHIFNKRHAD